MPTKLAILAVLAAALLSVASGCGLLPSVMRSDGYYDSMSPGGHKGDWSSPFVADWGSSPQNP